MGDETYTRRDRRSDCALAEKMGWTEIELRIDPHDPEDPDWDYFGEVPVWYLDAMVPCIPFGIIHHVPYFHCHKMTGAGEAAKATLLHWLAQNEVRWLRFYGALAEIAQPRLLHSQTIMLVTPRQVAEAAIKSLEIEVRDAIHPGR